MDTLQDTPRANRLHIGIFGKRNSGKSSLINALTNQEVALVSSIPGTTTDPVYKSMELHGIGPVVFIDTAGFDDSGELGAMRVEQTQKAMAKTDLAIIVINSADMDQEVEWAERLRRQKTPIVVVVNKADILADGAALCRTIKERLKLEPILASARERQGIGVVREALVRALPESYEMESISSRLVQAGDTVLLVMPQDIQAPKGRLILPQVQTIRDLLDRKCIVISVTLDQFAAALDNLAVPPSLIITDSQVFPLVYAQKPAVSRLTSFSVLFAAYKGDIDFFVDSAAAIDRLTAASHVLIAEACTHAPLSEDIGREKIPRLLRKKIGEDLNITIVSGTDFPADLAPFDLVIHCGACMFNRKYVLSRITQAKQQQTPMTNYGVALAYLAGILDQIDF